MDTEQEDLHPQVLAQTAALIEDEPEDEETDPSFQVNAPKATSFDLAGPNKPGPNTPYIIKDEENTQIHNVTSEFLKYHHKFNHCSPRRMQLLTRSGVIPRRLAQFPVPVCSSCLHGKSNQAPLAY